MSSLPRACLIDVYDTILRARFLPRMERLIEPLGLTLGQWLPEWEKDRADRDRGKLTTAASIGRALRALGLDPDPALVAETARRDRELMRDQVELCDDTVPFLTWLRSAGVLTALVSNCADNTRQMLDRLGIIPLVDATVLSCEVGSAKPFPEIYVTALEDLGVAAVDAIFIDDQPTFCMGAQAVGVRPVQVDRDGTVTPGSGWDFPVVRSLDEVKSLL